MQTTRCGACGTRYETPRPSRCRACGKRLGGDTRWILLAVVATLIGAAAFAAYLGPYRERARVADARLRLEAVRRSVDWVYSPVAGVRFTRSEVTLEQYRRCVEIGPCAPLIYDTDTSKLRRKLGGSKEVCMWRLADLWKSQASAEAYAVNCVTWDEAGAYCAWIGGRLPTSDEWYAEASNGGARVYPWGDDPAGCGTVASAECQGFRAVCSFATGNSVSGLCDMAGSLAEWTADTKDTQQRIVRGRARGYEGVHQILTEIDHRYRGGRFDDVGFRCAKENE
ncbi:MAG: SUMF1/EgtB/PvdO family nonheme iron enzyme [Deltaproteobacteria bacterium]